jgi:hypothetical protein
MSSNRTDKSSRSSSPPPLVRLAVVTLGAGVATWVAATMLATARAGQESRDELRRPLPEAVAAAADAEAESTAAPSADPASADSSVEERMRKRRAEAYAGAGVKADSAPDKGEPDEAEWSAAAAAMEAHTPNAIRRINRSSPNFPARARMMRALVDRHRELQRIKARDPEQYKRELEQTKLEDEILGASRRLARESDMAGAYEIRVQIRDMVTKLVDLRIANREARLERLAETLEAERKRLAQDKENRAKAIERQLNVVTRRGGSESGPPSRPGAGQRDPSLPPLPPPPPLGSPPPGE